MNYDLCSTSANCLGSRDCFLEPGTEPAFYWDAAEPGIPLSLWQSSTESDHHAADWDRTQYCRDVGPSRREHHQPEPVSWNQCASTARLEHLHDGADQQSGAVVQLEHELLVPRGGRTECKRFPTARRGSLKHGADQRTVLRIQWDELAAND